MKNFGFRFAGFVAIVGMFAFGSTAFAQVAVSTATQTVETAVVTLNSLTVTPTALVLILNEPNALTLLTYSTNDGGTYAIKVSAAAWVFTPVIAGADPSGYPRLRVTVPVTHTLIDYTNTPTPSASAPTLYSGLKNATATVGVTLLADNENTIVAAGLYSTTLTYTLQ